MGTDEYESRAELRDDRRFDRPPVGIGAGSVIRHAIVDKNARIGSNVRIGTRKRNSGEDTEGPGWVIRDGIAVVLKHAVIPDGTTI